MSHRPILRALLRSTILATTVLSTTAFAGDVEGTIRSMALERPIEGARIVVEGTGRSATTDEAGRYMVRGLTGGRYTIRVQQPGYDDTTIQVLVPDEGAVEADGVLSHAGEMPEAEIVVTGARASRLLAIERKRALPVISDVVSSDGIGRLPDYNTAEAVQRLPGVSVEIDQGEPRYVVIRGVDPNLNQVTVDGNLVGVPEAEGRRVALDTIPSDLVAAIEVIKAVTPDYDGNAVGGSINIVTPTAFDRAAPFTFLSARGAYNAKSDKLGFGGSATHGRRFGVDESFGVVIAGSYFKRFIDSDLAEPRNWTTIGGVATPTAYRLYDYRIVRERIGTVANFDWRPDPDMRFYLRTIYNEFTDVEERDQFDFSFAAPVSFPAPDQIRFGGGRATREFRQNDQTQRLYNISPGAEFSLGNAELELNYTYAHAEEHTPIRDDIEFRSAKGKFATLDLTSARPLFADFDPSLFEEASFPLRRIRLRREQIDEDLHTARADMRIAFGDTDETFLKFGAKYIDRTKTRDNTQSELLPAAPITPGGFDAVLPPPENFYEGEYRYGPLLDYGRIIDFFEANPDRFVLNSVSTTVNERSVDYRVEEKITAGYAMVSGTTGDLTMVAGLRVEHTDGRYDAFAIRDTNGNGTLEPSDLVPLSFDREYTDFLPSVHATYRPTPELLVRAAYTNTLGRPNYDAIVPTFEEDSGDGTAGNPDLKPFRSTGLDLSVEFYPAAGSVLSVAGFYKHIENPIFTRTVRDVSFAGIPLTSLSQPQNATDGDLLGVEANIVQRFTFLPAPFDGLGASANFTYVDSSVTVPGREDEDIPFFRQSDLIAGGALFFENGPVEARLAFDYRDDYIVNIGSSTASDIYNKSRFALDARISYRITPDIEIFASGSNLTDATLTFYQTLPEQTFSRQIYGINADFGISARF
ncbi:TonB-dependent receptor [Qipengyuania pelagi]|uniref:TonB-dependent receptor n=1 Tax=Qipengyuania pelagi TaxID=994320 RepID=A0A844Y9N0_9SPHN|nr:TonB-dependent receptor [Qipengyuania pelagi]MXO54149.1 TonB-dependent receptor [Qipengyuania pelagi]